MQDWRQNFPAFSALISAPLFWLGFFFLLPLGLIWMYSFGENVSLIQIETTWTLDNYARIFRPEIMSVFWRSLWISGLATFFCVVIGFPVALMIATASPRAKPWLLLLIVLPFWTNLLIRTYALLSILGAKGQLNNFLKLLWDGLQSGLQFLGLAQTGFLSEPYSPFQFLGSTGGVVFGMVYIFLPFAVLPIYSSLERMDRSYLEASSDLGASQMQTFFKILVPLAMSGIITATIITFIPALGQFLTPDLLGRGQVDMIANIIERQFKKANDWPYGSALSLFLLYITFIVLALKSFADARGANKRGQS